MKRNKNYRFQRIVLRLVFLLWFFFFIVQGILAQPQWSDDDKVNNPIATFPGSNQFAPAVAKDGSGGAIITWVDNRNGNFDVFFQRIEPSGKISFSVNGIPVDSDPQMASQEAPSIVEGFQGDFFIAWQDNRNESSDKEIFVQKFNIEGKPQWNPATRAHGGNNSAPLVIRNGSFGVLTASYISVLFDDFITYQFINNEGTPQLARQGFVSDSAKGQQPNRPPAVISGLDGGLIATWVDTRNGLPAVFAKGIKRSGTSTSPWSQDEVLVSSRITDQTFPVAISDGQGGAIIAWINPVSGSQDNIKVQRFNVDGVPQWGAGGTVISTIQGKKRNIKIASDGRNGAYLIWENLIGTNWKLMAQRVSKTKTGVPWPNDLRLSLAGGDQTNAALINDGRGQAIAAWEDNRNGNLDIFAQKVDSLGVARLWGEEGVAVSTAPGAQRKPVMVDDEFGGAIIAWEDQRNITANGTDIYAQKVSGPGVLGEVRAITIKAPNGGENWERESTHVISWEWTGEIEKVLIQVSKDGGVNWQDIFPPTPIEVNSIAWKVDVESSGQWLLRLTDMNFNFINDVSDQTFTISEPQGPTIEHSRLSQASYGDSLLVATEVKDLSGVAEVSLHYRKGGAQTFASVPMLPDTGEVFTQVIPAASVTERGVQYFISSTDSIGQVSTTAVFSVSVNFEAGVQTAQIKGGTSQSAYRMISAPNNLDEIFADSIFAASGFGALDTTRWRLFLYQDTGYVELDSTTLEDTRFTFKPGKAFWLITDRNRTIDYGSGASLRADTIFTIRLKPGWNQIGLPFAFPIAWDDILAATRDSLKVDGPFLYTGTYTMPDVLMPYEGYFVNNLDNLNAITLNIPPKETAIEPLTKTNEFNSDWTLQIKASCQEARDEFNFLGIHQQASDSWDPLDHGEPPPIGESISVYFPHKDWQVYPNNYTTDFRNTVAEGQTWSFIVNTNIGSSEARIVVAGFESVPQDLEIMLLDEGLNISQDLRKDNVYIFPTGPHGTSKNLKILVGNSEFLAEEASNSALVPENFELSQNFPNPFNPVTSIRFGLPYPEKVRIRVFDILGKEVATLMDNEEKEAGYHLVTWNGKDRYGREVASGVYVYRLEAGKFSQTRKMLLLQ